jgi:hypothetical protein
LDCSNTTTFLVTKSAKHKNIESAGGFQKFTLSGSFPAAFENNIVVDLVLVY